MKIEINYDIPNDIIEALITTAFGQGSTYWIVKAVKLPSKELRFKSLPTVHVDYRIYEEEGDAEDLTYARVRRGLKRLAKLQPQRFKNLIDQNFDAVDADLWLQYALFGEIKYN